MSTRNEHATQARKARLAAQAAEQQRRARQQQRVRVAAAAGALLAVAGGVTLIAVPGGGDDRTSATTASSSTGVRDSAPPWPVQPDGLAARIATLAFPPVGDESYHAHTLLTVYRDGEQVEVPANIGFDRSGAHSSLHTHTPDGVVHMEADDPYPYTLQEFFTVWGVAFDREQGRLGADADPDRLHVYVNGEPAPEGEVPMSDGDNIVVAFGERGSFPTEPPADVLQAQ